MPLYAGYLNPVYGNPLALCRDSAHILTTHSTIQHICGIPYICCCPHLVQVCPMISMAIQSAPYDLLSGWKSCQDSMFTVGLVILPGLHAWWKAIKVKGPNQEVGTTQPSLARTPYGAIHEWHMVQSS